MVETIKNFWNHCHIENIAASLTGSPYTATITALKLEDYIKPNINILEIGVGLGYVTEGLYKDKLNVSCLDISDIALARVGKYCEKTYSIKQLAELPSEYFDVIICVNVVQHVPTDLLVEELNHCVRSLKGTGIFAIEFVSNNTLEDTGINPSLSAVKGGVCCRTPKYLEKLIKDAGGYCEMVEDVKCSSDIITGCHVFHVRKES